MKVLIAHDKDLSVAVSGRELCSDAGGGLALYLAAVVAGLAAKGDQVVTLDLRPGAQHAQIPGAQGAERIAGFRFRYRAEPLEQLSALLARERFDVVHLHGVHDLHPAFVARLRSAAPLVRSFHDVAPVCLRRTLVDQHGRACQRCVGWGCWSSGCQRPGREGPALGMLLELARLPRWLASHGNADAVVVPSDFLRAALERNGIQPGRVRVLPLFPMSAPPPASLSAGDGQHLLFVGRLVPEKGVAVLLAALAQLAPKWPGIRATLVGAGPQRAELERQAEAAGLVGRVLFTGELSGTALAQAYASADMFVLPSTGAESFGLVGIEALAAGLPVVAADCGGVREWLVDGQCGRLVTAGDSRALAHAIAELLGNPTLRAELGSAGRRLQRERFTEAKHLAAVRSLYGELCAQVGVR